MIPTPCTKQLREDAPMFSETSDHTDPIREALNACQAFLNVGAPTALLDALPTEDDLPILPTEAARIDRLTRRAIHAHKEALRCSRKGFLSARKCGSYLLEIRAQKDGEWEEWCKANLPFTVQQARTYMTLARHPVAAAIAADRKRAFGLSQRAACRAIKRADRDVARKQIIALAKPAPDDHVKLYHCDFRGLEAAGGKLALVDAPYGPDWRSNYPDLAKWLWNALDDNAIAGVWCGLSNTPELMDAMRSVGFKWKPPFVHHFAHNSYQPIKDRIIQHDECYLWTKGDEDYDRCTLWHKGQPTQPLNLATAFPGLVPKEKAFHPSQKPLSVINYLVSHLSHSGDLVLDCCAGSFTVAVSCKLLGRRGICGDDTEDNIKIGYHRLTLVRSGAVRLEQDSQYKVSYT